MYTPQDLHGVMAMMPAFATADAADIRAEHTVDVDHLKEGVDKIIRDGVNVIATTGSFGEFHTLLPDEFETLARATVEAVAGRVPLFIGATGLNSRDAVRKIAVARDAGAQGVLVGVPFYFPSTVANALRFYRDVGELFPTMSLMIYHNPALHNIHIPVDAFPQLLENRNVVGMKDSHRNPRSMMELHRLVAGRLSHFVHAGQYFGFAPLGAAGLWSYDCWMGPWPVLALRDAMDQGDLAKARDITFEITDSYDGPMNLQWRETAAKLAIGAAGYVQPGPLRPPFVEIPPEVQERIQKRAQYWTELCARYRPLVEARA